MNALKINNMKMLRSLFLWWLCFFALLSCYGADKNLALDAMVSVSKGEVNGEYSAEYAVDGKLDKNYYLECSLPCVFQIDMGEIKEINCIHIFPYWDDADKRCYQYFIELSDDAEKWEMIADARKKSESETEQGTLYKFKAVKTRFIRVTFTRNSVNSSAHLVEVKVFERN